MGLSASQARLLSITQRLSNNELESQILSNAKIQLSTKNTLATEKYIAALDSTEMQYISYNDNGITESIALTFNSLTAYSPLKNQYNLYNAQGQLMVNEEDARNFETTSTLSQFLDKYGLYDESKLKNSEEYHEYELEMEKHNEKMEKYGEELEAYNNAYDAYIKRRDGYTDESGVYHQSWQEEMDDYNAKYKDYTVQVDDYNVKLAKYEEDLRIFNTIGNPYQEFTNVVGSIADGTQRACYSTALSNSFDDCYLHVLGHLLNPYSSAQTFTTSTGDNITVSVSDVTGAGIGTDPALLQDTRNAILFKDSEGKYFLKCDGDDKLTNNAGDGVKDNSLQEIINAGGTPTKLQQLLSDYIYDPTTKTATEVKSLAQKTIDLTYLIKTILSTPSSGNTVMIFGEALTKERMKEALINYTEGDMKKLQPEPPVYPTFTATHPGPAPTFGMIKPAPPEEPEAPTLNLRIYDREKAQWYTNLWYAMDGQQQTGEVKPVHDNEDFSHYIVEQANKNSKMEIQEIDSDGNIVKAIQLNQFYTVINKANATDSSWLQYMLTSGTVTMQQAALRTTGFITWEGIEFSSTSDIREVQDDTKIAKAEAEYEEAVAQIQAEDKIIDAKNKKLDTEHSALKTEIESIKNVMTKNIEKSFTAFS